MAVIAVAGGSGNVGRTIVDTLAKDGMHKVIVLGRKIGEFPEGVLSVVVDYSDVIETQRILAHHKVHTVVSAIQVVEETTSKAQVDLVKAAARSGSVRRFIATGWGAMPNKDSPTYGFLQAAKVELKTTNLEWTKFVNGFFLDYYGAPHIKTQMPTITFAIDMKSKKAAIPGTGNEPIAFTYSYDVAKFVSKLLDMNEWQETTYCYGEKMTWNEFVKVAEEVTGSTFDVTYDSVELLATGKFTELPPHAAEIDASPFPEALARQLLAILGLWAAEGYFNVPVSQSLNEKVTDFKPKSVRDVLAIGQGL